MTKRRAPNRSTYTETDAGSILRVRGNEVRLLKDDVPQSCLNLKEPENLVFEYMQHMDLFFSATEKRAGWEGVATHVFHAGAGALALPLAWNVLHERMTQLAIDIDEDLVREIRKVADLTPDHRVQTKAEDAESVLLGSSDTYNVVVRDAFAGPSTPLHLQAKSFHELVASRLKKTGLYLANVGHDSVHSGKPDLAGIADVFRHVAVITDPSVWHRGQPGNLTVAAWHNSGPELDYVDRVVRSHPLPTRLYRDDTVRKWLGDATPVELTPPAQG